MLSRNNGAKFVRPKMMMRNSLSTNSGLTADSSKNSLGISLTRPQEFNNSLDPTALGLVHTSNHNNTNILAAAGICTSR